MSSALPSDGPSNAADGEPAEAPEPGREAVAEPGLISLLRSRGAPLLEALEAHHPASRERSEAASAYAFAAAVELGMSRESADLVREVARLQEVGHVYVPAEVLAKPAADRSSDEVSQLEAHHEKGAQLARGAGLPDQVCEWIRFGAERYDGTGPNGLANAAIPLQSRITAAALACYSALSESRAEGSDRAPAEVLRASARRELDPRVVDALAGVLDRVG